MNLLVWIPVILFVNKLSVFGETILQNINLTAANEAHSGLKFDSYETSVKVTLSEFNFQKDELANVGNPILRSSSGFEKGLQSPQTINLTIDDMVRLDLKDKPNLVYRLPEMEVVKGIGGDFETEKSVTTKANVKVFPDAHPVEQEDNKHMETIREEAKQITAQYEDTKQKLSTESEGIFLRLESHNLTSTQTRDLSTEPEEIRGVGDTVSTGLTTSTTARKHISRFDPATNFISHEKVTTMPNAYPNLLETQNNRQDKYDSSNSNLTRDLSASEVHGNKQKNSEDNLNSFNQSWPENRAKTINEYRLATKSFDSDDTSHLTGSELIEIVLKEATNLNKTAKETNLSSALATSNNEIFPLNIAETALTGKASEEGTNLRNENASILLKSSELMSIILKNVKESQNYSAEITNLSNLQEEKAAISQEQLDRNVLEGKESMSNTQSSLKLEANLTDLDELTARMSNGLTSKTINEPKSEVTSKEDPNSNQMQEKYLLPSKSLEKIHVAVNELSQSSSDSIVRQHPSNDTDKKLENSVTKEVSSLHKNQNGRYLNSLAKTNITFYVNKDLSGHSFNPFEDYQNVTEIGDNEKEAVLKKTGNENDFSPVKDFSANETIILKPKLLLDNANDKDIKKETFEQVLLPAPNVLITKPSIHNEESHTSHRPDEELRKVTNLSNKVTETETSSSSLHAWNKFEAPNNYAVTERNSAKFSNHQLPPNKQKPESSSLPLEEDEKEEEVKSMPKPIISLEEYAVKQMNFILDHLLLETQKLVANVLQATINSVFPRDRLKHYAEGVTQMLSPIATSDYSDEVLENAKNASQDEIYEQIVEKLDFLKSKPSRYLQKQIPPEWLNEFLAKRSELATWLDKAAVEMHKEFTGYITEEQDPIKYQYFNETFDDIARATEIHHKLAFLADLVKIIKNKKQITFMDLYMQTS